MPSAHEPVLARVPRCQADGRNEPIAQGDRAFSCPCSHPCSLHCSYHIRVRVRARARARTGTDGLYHCMLQLGMHTPASGRSSGKSPGWTYPRLRSLALSHSALWHYALWHFALRSTPADASAHGDVMGWMCPWHDADDAQCFAPCERNELRAATLLALSR